MYVRSEYHFLINIILGTYKTASFLSYIFCLLFVRGVLNFTSKERSRKIRKYVGFITVEY